MAFIMVEELLFITFACFLIFVELFLARHLSPNTMSPATSPGSAYLPKRKKKEKVAGKASRPPPKGRILSSFSSQQAHQAVEGQTNQGGPVGDDNESLSTTLSSPHHHSHTSRPQHLRNQPPSLPTSPNNRHQAYSKKVVRSTLNPTEPGKIMDKPSGT